MAKDFLRTRDLNDAAHSAPESPPASSTSSEKAEVYDESKKVPGSTTRRTRSKPSHRHRISTAMTTPSGCVRTAPVKVFPWVLVLLLLLVILRLQTTLSSIERNLLMNTQLINQLQQQVVALQAGACPVTA
ncbi:hypothetical protein PHYSODRAFT_285218 [Phytophthora sojae]|uniref:Uncharacterized protein n=1 Tax=Phytophthora sojae (strain P6497) TaxID=1094619 RepID=G4Z1P7_PHYSP|nr:hypothetical protein PHYSODRAFT_285218 [Phytophthora sojae]EGZ26415.1 hypothetical protein PHYSODRAFT_285218 [Phytophthora sojae]|eukprot:XP_009521703.1 hypothetical protein PHYSODRAFT_285218 [Phytophthora sojae]